MNIRLIEFKNSKRFLINRILGISLLILSGLFYSQSSPAQIDSLYSTTYELRKQGKYHEAIELNVKLIKDAKSQNYIKGAAYSCFEVANLYHNLGNYKESLVYLDKALDYNKDIKIPELYSKVYTELGKNYSMLSLLQNAIDNYKKAEQWAVKIADKSLREKSLAYVYSCQAVSYEAIGDLNASILAAEKAFSKKQDIISATRLAKNYILYKNDLIKGKEFLDFSEGLLKLDSSVTPYQKIVFLHAKGLYYNKSKEYKKSAEAYLKGIELAKELKRPNEEKELYKNLYQTYKDEEKNENERLKALEKYTLINDSIDNKNKEIIEIPIHKIVNEKNEINKQNYRVFLFVGVTILMIVLLVAYVQIQKVKKRKKISILEKEEVILKKEEVILKKEEETKELKQKVNESFVELVQLAKENSPQFWIRFQEVYPTFLSKMLDINPKFTTAELILSAYIYIGASSKEIASYTYRSLKTIENTRYSLRKKLLIAPDENLSMWLRNYIANG